MIEFRAVGKTFGDRNALEDFSLVCAPGEITVLIGPSGCGKTTALKLVNRLLEPDAGEILLRERPARDYAPVDLRRGIGYAIQEVGLFPHYNVFDNIAVLPRLLRWPPERVTERVRELLELVTLDERYERLYPAELSGGERQRVGLARALGADPDILLMDEPFGAIDPINRARLQNTFLEIQERLKKTILLVTHDIDEAIKLGDRIAVLRNGRLLRFETPAELLRAPDDPFVAELLGGDRNVKALALRKTRDIVQDDGFLVAAPEESSAEIRARLLDRELIVAYLVGPDGRLSGRRYVDRRRDELPLVADPRPVRLERNTALNDALSTMLASGETLLPVVGPAGEFLGAVTLTRMFAVVSGQADSSGAVDRSPGGRR